jgi:hypothetical protein
MSERLSLELPSHNFLAQLARDDPPAYEALRCELIEGLVDSAPEGIKPRLRGLQFRIDGIRRLSPSPFSAAGKIFSLMWESFLRLDEELSYVRGSRREKKKVPGTDARIIEFRPRRFVKG